VRRLDPSGADQADAEHPARNRKVEGSCCSVASKSRLVIYESCCG
jgi:hypothetical protein